MGRHQSFKSNALSLYAIQGLQYLVPFFTLPILTSRLGLTGFGQLAYWQSLVGTLGLLVDYGFNYSAVRSLTRANGDRKQVAKIFLVTMTARLTLTLPALLLLLVIPHWLPPPPIPMQLLGAIFLIGMATSPAWYLIGVKRNVPLAYAGTATAIGTIFLTLWLVRGDQALYIAAAIQFSAPLVNSLIANCFVFRLVPPGKAPISAREVSGVLRDGFPLFLTSLSAGLYTTLNPFILGTVTTPAEVSFFSFGERIARSARAMLTPLMSAIYPYSVSAATQIQHHKLVRRASILLTISAASLTIIAITAAPLVVRWLAPGDFSPSIAVTRILSINILTVTLSNLIGVQALVAKGMDQIVTWIVALAVPVHLVAFLLTGRHFGSVGGSIAYVLTEIAVTGAFAAYAISRHKRKPCNQNICLS